MPDPIMGGKAYAFVAPRKWESFTFEEMVSFLRGKKIAVYKVPERLEVRKELPLKGHQKIAKGPLRDEIARILREEGHRKS
jgi:non-ribosomal peptide synthetase component E (peptide arylation enzyme)